MAKTQPNAKRDVPGLLVTTKEGVQRVDCAGAYWAGVSHVPASHVSEAQLLELRACAKLTVEDVAITIDDGVAAA